MKSYEHLTASEQRLALASALHTVLTEVCEGRIQFDDGANGDGVQARVDAALDQADAEEAPWFAAELVYKAAKERIDEIAEALALETVYLDAGERAVYLGGQSVTVRPEDERCTYPRGIGTA